jgi:hypothetical protein
VREFDAPLDRALVFTSIAVADECGEAVHGTIEVGPGEREWWFIPARPSAPGRCRVHVAPEL